MEEALEEAMEEAMQEAMEETLEEALEEALEEMMQTRRLRMKWATYGGWTSAQGSRATRQYGSAMEETLAVAAAVVSYASATGATKGSSCASPNYGG